MQIQNKYENVQYEFVKIPDGFHFIYIYNQRESFKIVLRPTIKWIGSAILSGSITVNGSENEQLVNAVYSHDDNFWFGVDDNILDKIICLDYANNTTTVAACKTEEAAPNITIEFQIINGNFTISPNVGLYIVEGTGIYNDKNLVSKDYIVPKEFEREIFFSNAKCFLINTNEIL